MELWHTCFSPCHQPASPTIIHLCCLPAGPADPAHRMYLSPATLVVVTPELLDHWESQIRWHVDRHAAGGLGLRVLKYTVAGRAECRRMVWLVEPTAWRVPCPGKFWPHRLARPSAERDASAKAAERGQGETLTAKVLAWDADVVSRLAVFGEDGGRCWRAVGPSSWLHECSRAL